MNKVRLAFLTLLIVGLLGFAISSPASADPANLLSDGSFEAPLVPGLYVPPLNGTTTLGAWTLYWVNCPLGCGSHQSYPLATGAGFPDGTQALNIGRSFDPGIIAQSFTTVIGQEYDVSFWAINGAGFADGQGTVRIDGASGNRLYAVFTNGNTAWMQFSYSFTAADTTSTIQLRNLGSGGASSHDAMIVDDIRVTAPADSTPPVVTVPADQEVVASGPVAVGYPTATATDEDPASPLVSCSPASGSVFSIGDTSVLCSATDTAGNIGQASFTVTVLTPQAATDDLIEGVQELVENGTLNQGDALISKLENVIAKLDKGNTGAACNQLGAFTNQINAYVNAGILTPEEGQGLIDAVTPISSATGC